MASVWLLPEPAFNHVVSHLGGVKGAVREHAHTIGTRAEALLAPHRKTGNAHIEVKSGDVDSTVSLVDPAAVYIEFGHKASGWYANYQGPNKLDHIEGLNIIRTAAGLG